jgi:predicted nucleic acid-binding protein
MYLVDTDVISASAPDNSLRTSEVGLWLARNGHIVYLSAVTVGEIEAGIAKSRRTGAIVKADRLATWRDTVINVYADRILPLGVSTALIFGRLLDLGYSLGRMPGIIDVAIAATSLEHGLTLLTRNVRHYEPLGIACTNPFAALPDQKS